MTWVSVLAGPLDPPPELLPFARQVMQTRQTTRGKLEALLRATFSPTGEGGLGMVYDNSHTRTVAEAWQEHRANCLTLTAFYVAACHAGGIEAQFAEVLNINRWQRRGDTIRLERHVVALVHNPPLEDLIADFLPEVRPRSGVYLVSPLSRERILALYHSNRAVEFMDAGDPHAALVEADRSLAVDAGSGIGWNTEGVVQQRLGHPLEAEQAFRRSLELDPTGGAALENLEILLRSQGREREADHFREIGYKVRRRDPYFRARLAEESLAEGHLDEALDHAKAAVRLQIADPELFLLLARVRLARGQPEAALKALEKARRLAMPGDQERYKSKMDMIRAWRIGE
nr:tetratricopeptide repeat protein [uncultured Holophaga sp.]